uniref:Uncharacterized protein n=1 Tax=Ditylenchus dipsaci TaxID=166011 RepID=A0A915E674_9BILA
MIMDRAVQRQNVLKTAFNHLLFALLDTRQAIAAFILAHKTAVALTALATSFVAAGSKLEILQSKFDTIKKSLKTADQDLDKAESE